MNTETTKILTYLAKTQRVDISSIASDTLLFSSGLVDSFAMIDLVSYIEQDLGVEMRATDITLDNLDTLDRIATFVRSRM